MTDVLAAKQRARLLTGRQLTDAGRHVQRHDQLNLFAGAGVAARETCVH